ncbi:MAG: leucine-rich repeat protein [Alistipes sp.]|nr:leucine-rich repeat protein [Alistipes sp.]
MKKLLLFVFAALAFAACTQDVVVDITPAPIVDNAPETLVVGFEGDDTRIQLQNGKTVWTKGDQVSVFYRSNANQLWKYDGETGERTAYLKRVDAGSATRDMDRVVVVYPYNEDYYINPSTYNVQASLPATQHYLANSYGLDGNIMISSAEYNDVTLKNVCGWLKLQLTGDGEVVKSITFKGNNGEQVAGELYINSAEATAILASDMGNIAEDDGNNATGGAGANLSFDDVVLKKVTLDCGEGVALGKNATAFYIALPPQTFEQGFTVEIEDTEGYVMEQETDKALLIERNTILPMAAFEFINPATPSAPAPASNEIWYTATAKVEPTFNDSFTFGSDVVSNVWDSETKRGIIAFNGDVTMIGVDAFNNCDKLTSITLPECVTSIGKQAFYDCDGLTEFTIPDSVTEVGANAFYTCDKLASVTIGDSVTSIGDYAFYDCYSLTSVNIPDSVTTIGYQTFNSCGSLTEFTGKFAEDNGRILVVDGVLTAFAPAGITEYNIPDSVTTIEDYAFNWCSRLTSVNIPDSVTEIGSYAFYYCTSLKQVYCYATIPPSLGSSAFSSNASGRRIYVYEECVELYKSAWSSYNDSIYTNGQNCPDTTTIEYTTNDGNTITPSKLPIISNIYENGVGTLVYSGNGKQIPNSAFLNCTSLTSVNIPDSVTSIGEYAFLNCTSLTSVYCKATTPPSLGSNAFKYFKGFGYVPYGCDIYVPVGSVETYKSAEYWSEYASAIVGYDFENGVVVE